ncbi:MAG TPA: HAD-IA family hydrolase [Thermoplasmata archaeon]|nr:HAD-IA family hydrolase [Thermoplasmata archaeon]
MKPLGVVFDLDGTLVLSHHDFARMRAEIVRTAEHYGVSPGPLTADEVIGTTHALRAARQELEAAHVPERTILRFESEVSGRIDAVEMEALPRTVVRAGAGDLLRGVHERGVRLGLFTRSSEAFCRAALGRAGLSEFFPYIRTRSSPGPSKPSPDALRLLLRGMEVSPKRAVFVGDHLEDARCATSAGVLFYGVLPDPEQPNPTTAEQFRASGAAAVASDLSEIARLLAVAPTDGRRSRRR